MLKVNNIVKDYVIDSDTIRVLDDISFDVKEGEILGIIGRSGGGKSTILKVLRGMEPFVSGSFELDGFTVKPDASIEDKKTLMKMAAIHLQRNFGLWSGATYENVLRRVYAEKFGYESLPDRDSPYYQECYETSLEYLKLVNLDSKAEHFSQVLSGGEKQRLLIARQLASKPKLLLLDEPATMTCPATKQGVLDTPCCVGGHVIVAGSSRRRSLGFDANCLAINNLCFSPPLNTCEKCSALESRFTSFKYSRLVS